MEDIVWVDVYFIVPYVLDDIVDDNLDVVHVEVICAVPDVDVPS